LQDINRKECIMTIAITGATGQLGTLALAALKARGANPIALVRNPAKITDDTPTRAFDYHTADAAALAGVDTLVLISSNDFNDRYGQHAKVIGAAKAAGVGRIIYTGILKGAASPMALAQDHIKTEAALAASGIPATILRNGWYTENYTGSLGGTLAAGTQIGATGEGRVSGAARADYAEAIAVVATDAAHAGKIHELAGDAAFTLADYAAEVSRQTGRNIPYVNMAQPDYAEALKGFGLPAGFAEVLADSDAKAAVGALYDDSRTLSRLIGRPTTPMAATVAAALAAL
jgi:NAD(P)H dehydrogenase (quinone)